MKKPKIDVQTYTNDSFCLRRGDKLCLFYLEIKNDQEATLCVHENFWKELEKLPKSRQNLITEYLKLHMQDEFRLNKDPSYHFYRDYEGYRIYCQATYKLLDDFQKDVMKKYIEEYAMEFISNPENLKNLLKK